MKRLSLAVVVMFVSLAALCQGKTIFVMSDIHVMAPELLVNDGEAFQKYIASDPKLLRKSSEVLNALVDTIRKYQPDLVLIPGDLTKDGELVSHRLVAETLGKIRDEGIPILLVPGNHDIDNPEGVYYDGSATRYAERTSPAVFAELYKDFGYGDDAVRDENSLSWVAEPFDGLVIIGIDTNWYEKNKYKEKGDPVDDNTTSGGIKDSTLEWVLDYADRAVAEGKQVVAICHHNVVEHFDGQSVLASPYVVEDWENVSRKFIKHGISIVFTGHQHMQDVAKYYSTDAMTDSLIDVTTGASVSYPNPWRLIKVNEDFSKWDMTTGYVKSIGSLPDVQATCRQTLSENITGGLKWHIRAYWPTIQEKIEENSDLIEKWKVDVPKTPEELTDLAMTYFGDLLTELVIINDAGNEPDDPRSEKIFPEIKERLSKLVKDKVGTAPTVVYNTLCGYLDDNVFVWLNSVLTDTNAWGTPRASVTDDLTGRSRGRGGNNGGDVDGRYYDLNGRFVGTSLRDLGYGIYVTKGKKLLKVK